MIFKFISQSIDPDESWSICESIFSKSRNLFSVPSENNTVEFATEARISLIANPYDCAIEVVDAMLENYFLHPRYLHVNDVFIIDAKEYAQDRFYSSASPANSVIYFVVKSLKLDRQRYNASSCYVVRGISTLIQEAQIHSYIPKKHLLVPRNWFSNDQALLCQNEELGRPLNNSYPSALAEPFEYLESCITPFVKNGTFG